MNTLVELMNKLRSPDNKHALKAVEDMRLKGWLEDGSLRGSALCRAQLQSADLMRANLSGVDFHQAHLEWADLSMTNLRGAKLTRTNLMGANFNQTDLTSADLYKVNLRGAINLTTEQFRKVKRLWGATMPDGNPYDGRFNLTADIELARWGKIDVDDPQAMADFYGVSVEQYLAGQDILVNTTIVPA